MPNTTPQKNDPLSISQLNRQAKRLLEGNFPSVWVEGEISNLARPSSGHWYFSLKDSSAQVRCAMFRSHNARLRFAVEAGQQVVARAKLSLYEARGDYQLLVEHLQPAGDGALAKAFEALKNKLNAQGLFDSARKKQLPEVIRHIAVVTSATGAAIRDILTVLGRRFPAIEITIFPTQVQGKEAAAQIDQAIRTANRLSHTDSPHYNFDVILVGRGGGSLEDLWPFNEERVALSINDSELPVVSAIGHEVDFTIADFVADLRAATPSAAAELLSPDQREWFETLEGFTQILINQINSHLQHLQRQLQQCQSRLKHPGSRLREHSQRLDELEVRLLRSWQQQLRHRQHLADLLYSRLCQQTPTHAIGQLRLTTGHYQRRLQQLMQHILQQQGSKLESIMQLLHTVSPLATLDRGYAIITDNNGHIISDSDTVTSGEKINAQLAKGKLSCTVDACLSAAE